MNTVSNLTVPKSLMVIAGGFFPLVFDTEYILGQMLPQREIVGNHDKLA